MNEKQRIQAIFDTLAKHIKNPKTELIFKSDFELLVAVILSAQATDKSVNKATKELFIQYNTPKAILALGELGLMTYIRSIGLYKTKAKNIIKLCHILKEQPIPKTFNELVKLPGVGRKTANVVLNELYKLPTIAVDTHVKRLANRLGLSKESCVIKIEKDLLSKVPKKHLLNAHHYMILHGRYTCKACKPLCNDCKLCSFCKFRILS